ncbi:heme anaerobic degradation radical SAM methyltransferase ChuW/HutW [Anaerosinus massiliensis]|uniref:heme anaerobic degradation radical SAM methyltransferase ChuW/HutW n=1 Tax=Massilibacillus massiliensis TaxID=1806837 RepID=UPI000AE03153|nr:heme anaerobic degradation radical SAM methyltransferase ChuW/HutW [Massilibacillus massiliensis]
MKLETIMQTLSKEEAALQFGYQNVDPLTGAFPHKRVVHAGLTGRPVKADQTQGVWEKIMFSVPEQMAPRSVYIHIPFCQTRCLYCNFFQNAANQAIEDKYIDCLIQEIEASAAVPQMKDGLIHAVFIGGGTPTSLSPQNAKRLLQTIHDCLPLANDYELTLEGRIYDLVPEKMDIWMKHGVNRMSLGVQSFHTHIRRQLGRIDDQETVLKRLAELKAYQQCAVIVDLIYGLPDQDMKLWKEDLELLSASAVDGMDLYQLNVFEESEMNKRIQAGKMSPAADTARQAEMFSFAHDFLTKRAFKRLSICHWTRNNRERSLYNILAKEGRDMFPFGCGAGGSIGGYTTMLHRMLPVYEKLVKEEKKPCMVLMEQSPLQPIINTVLGQLEQGFLDLQRLIQAEPRLSELQWLYKLWEERGLVKYNGILYELTLAGQFWQVNLSQTTVECIQILVTGEKSLAVQKIAAQDGAMKLHPKIQHMPEGHPAIGAGFAKA